LWRRWRAGESLTDIASALQRHHSRIHHIVEAEGGMAVAPPIGSRRLNTRPRLTLGFQTPAAKLAEIVASTG
jgi:IS30 family transposase